MSILQFWCEFYCLQKLNFSEPPFGMLQHSEGISGGRYLLLKNVNRRKASASLKRLMCKPFENFV